MISEFERLVVICAVLVGAYMLLDKHVFSTPNPYDANPFSNDERYTPLTNL